MTEFAIKETTTKVWSKPFLQQVRKDLKAQGLNINKTSCDNGYELKTRGGKLLLKAMNGRNNYLVQYVSNLFV